MQENDTRKQISPAFSSTLAKHRHMILPHACFIISHFSTFFKPKCLLCNVFGRSHGKRAESARFSGRRLPVRHSPFHRRKHTMDWRYTPIFYTANSRKEISVMPAIIKRIVYDDRNQTGSMTWRTRHPRRICSVIYAFRQLLCHPIRLQWQLWLFRHRARRLYSLRNRAPAQRLPAYRGCSTGRLCSPNSPRTWTTTVTAAQIERNEVLAGQNFGHDVDAPCPAPLK